MIQDHKTKQIFHVYSISNTDVNQRNEVWQRNQSSICHLIITMYCTHLFKLWPWSYLGLSDTIMVMVKEIRTHFLFVSIFRAKMNSSTNTFLGYQLILGLPFDEKTKSSYWESLIYFEDGYDSTSIVHLSSTYLRIKFHWVVNIKPANTIRITQFQ